MPFVREIIKNIFIDLSSAMALRTVADVRAFITYNVKGYRLGASSKIIQITENLLAMTPYERRMDRPRDTSMRNAT